MKKNIRIVLHPGWVISATDRERHWISASQLQRLYQVRPGMFIICDSDKSGLELGLCSDEEILHLYPLSNGKYFDAMQKFEEET